ncbi:MAG: beta-glycosidase [Candidatus Symbiothrix sp.]|nr:beta-glycosidase [Candidatus Symbiothrix sp.]
MKQKTVFTLFLLLTVYPVYSQQNEKIQLPNTGEKEILNSGWLARRADEIKIDGNQLSISPFNPAGWMNAKVPGTVLTTLLENKIFPAPEFSMNNELIPDVYETGNDFYTFWFIRPFQIETLPEEGRQVWLNFRGINYKADIFLNGKRLNIETHEGMFLRETYNITPYLKTGGEQNLLAVIVYPPDYPGAPNGGQGGDGQIARNVTMQFTPGWDWIQAVRDRNTGIWDEVSVTVTGQVKVQHPYLVTKVPGIRKPEGTQKEAFINTTVELENVSSAPQTGILVYETDGKHFSQTVSLKAKEKKIITLKELTIKQPRLWWPNGIGKQDLYDMRFSFEIDGKISDSQKLRYGIREITSDKSPETDGRRFYVNGQAIYIPGGNYIASDWLLRLSPERYRAEVRYHAEMNLRMIRVWGGALLERPEFYDVCDEYGILVFQDLWGSGDCNGAWIDPLKLDSRERRWEYPDNHGLFLRSAEDQIKMVRNHPSLCLWCGANEWPLAKDIDETLQNDIFPRLDPNRFYAAYSTDSLFSGNTAGPVGDGPYTIQEPEWFFTYRSFPFNAEAGNVGSPEVESMREMMTEKELAAVPRKGRVFDNTWRYHRDLGYGDHLERYGQVSDIETYCKYAQAVNYDQYRSFMEGRASRMWEWYSGILIWKTQNPWTSLRGQMYDWFLDVNACLYGTKKGCEPLHPQYNLQDKHIEIVNSALGNHSVYVSAQLYTTDGIAVWKKEEPVSISDNQVKKLFPVPVPEEINGVYFLKLSLSENGKIVTSNIYWLTTIPKDYSGLTRLPQTRPQIETQLQQNGQEYTGTVRLRAENQISFFNRIKVFDKATGKRILPVHYSDNYITLMPGDEQEVNLQFSSRLPKEQIKIVIDSWTSERIETVVSGI